MKKTTIIKAIVLASIFMGLFAFYRAAAPQQVYVPIDTLPASHPHMAATEASLNCVSCHEKQGQLQTMHATMMGNNCASCHATKQWTIPEFKHPSLNSANCAQRHQEPPSHRMMHFNMMSRTIAKKPKATVKECYSCHLTTAWNDIKAVGWRKVH